MTHARTPRGALRFGAALATAVLGVLILLGGSPSGSAAAAPKARASGATSCPWVSSTAPISQRVTQVIGHMTLANEITMVEGAGTSNPYVFYMPGIPSLCIPALGEEDGPNGVGDKLTGVTQLPAGVALSATFDPDLAHQYGQVVGSEEFGKGASVNLGPTVNIDRDPRWGRSFETFTEDPFLNAAMAVNEIDGVQSTGEMSQVKHYDAYNQETNRNTPADDVIVSARTLHEIYMPAFDAAVHQANVASLMCSYSTINGAYACNNQQIETNVLRTQWGFPGFMTSDYGALHATTGALDGTDQEQPFNQYFGTPLEQAVSNGTIPRSVLNTMVARILSEMFRFNLIAQPPTGNVNSTVTTPAHQSLSNLVAETSATLLKNARDTLPLSPTNGGTIAVIGPSASASPTYGGGGSAEVQPSGTVSPLQGLQAAAGSGTHIVYSQGLPTDASLPSIPPSDLSPAYSSTNGGGSYTGTLTAPETGTYVLAIKNDCQCYTPTYLSVDNQALIDNPGTPPNDIYSAAIDLNAGQKYTINISGGSASGGGASDGLAWGTPTALAPQIEAAATAAKSASRAVVVVSDDTETEAADRLGLDLPSAQNELVAAVEGANPHTTVVINAGAPVTMPWLAGAGAVLDAWYPGQTSGTALAAVLFGQVGPSGHLPVTFPATLGQVPAGTPAQFPGIDNRVLYSEGLDVGYRYYDARKLKPLFPFGFGLSYTKFAYSDLHISGPMADGTGDITVTATVTNTGTRPGTDVAQAYLTDPRAAGEPPRQLAGFERVTLGAGQSGQVQFTITPRDTWWWDAKANGWTQSAGTYGVHVGDSSALANLPLHGSFAVPSTAGARQVRVSAPKAVSPGHAFTVTARLTAGGTATLPAVRFALQLPQGFTVKPLTQVTTTNLGPQQIAVAQFRVTAPNDAFAQNITVHATADLGPDAQREGGVTAAVR